MARINVKGVVTEKKESGVYVRQGHGGWFLPRESLSAAGITDVEVGDRMSFTTEQRPCGVGPLLNVTKG